MIRIHLNQQATYVAGSVVSGLVYLKSNDAVGETVDIDSISITFSGRSTTTKPSHESKRFRKSVLLFSKKATLCESKRVILPRTLDWRDSPHQWPFTFVFPQDCGLSRTEIYDVGPYFNSDRNQTLPNTFADGNGLDNCSIAYELQACLSIPQEKGNFTQSDKRELNLYVPRSSRKQDLKLTTITKQLCHYSSDFRPASDSEQARRNPTFKEKLGMKPSLRSLPYAIFEVKVQVPTIAILGQSVELFLHINHDIDNSTTASPPVVQLKNVSIWLRAETSICGMKEGSLVCKQEDTSWNKPQQIGECHFDTDMPKVDRLDLRNIMDLTLPSDLTPTFKTFNVARTYSFKVYLAVQCAGKTFPIYADYAPCTLLAKDDENEISIALPPEIDEPAIDEPPPPYERHDSTPPPHTALPPPPPPTPIPMSERRPRRTTTGLRHEATPPPSAGLPPAPSVSEDRPCLSASRLRSPPPPRNQDWSRPPVPRRSSRREVGLGLALSVRMREGSADIGILSSDLAVASSQGTSGVGGGGGF